ncbi:MAG: hypothetical protein DRO11_04440, partial [Methanobacteriota archaeon]
MEPIPTSHLERLLRGQNMPGMVHLGSSKLYWCLDCNLPLISPHCGLCGGEGVGVPLTPPGDVRPAMADDLALLRNMVDNSFGRGIGKKIFPDWALVLLNRCPDIDAQEEVVVGGTKYAIARFDPVRLRWDFKPYLHVASEIYRLGGGKWVRIDQGAVEMVVKGANVLSPGVVEMENSIEPGDEVYIVSPDNKVVGVG